MSPEIGDYNTGEMHHEMIYQTSFPNSLSVTLTKPMTFPQLRILIKWDPIVILIGDLIDNTGDQCQGGSSC